MEGMPSVMVDGLWVPAGKAALEALGKSGLAKHYLLEAYKHLKPMGLANDGKALLDTLGLKEDTGLLLGNDQAAVDGFVKALEQHRVWAREAMAEAIPA